jgi:O-antigen ligase
MKDLIKLLLALALYGGLAPLLGAWLAPRRIWQRAVFATMLVLTIMRPGNFMMMIGSIETYRGHTKGYEISLIEVLALALILAVRRAPRGLRLKARGVPGLGWYLLWCGVSLLSMFGSYEPTYALMALSRFAKGALIFAAAAMYLRDEKDLRWAVGALAGALFHHGLLCLKMRLFDGSWQVKGWFEHQNPMAMWCYLSALPVLAVMLSPQVKGRLFWLCAAGYGGAGLCILLSVSRAALAAYAAGSAILLVAAWLRGPSVRVTLLTMAGALGAVMVALFALDSFKARLNEVAESSQEVESDLRDILNQQSAAMLRASPLVGIGWNNFGIANSRPRGAEFSEILEEWDRDRGFTIYDENYYANPLTESLYWLWLAETGWLGLASFGVFALLTLGWALRNAWHSRGTLTGAVALALLVGLTICYAHGSVERILTQTKNLSHWLMLAGMVAGMERQRRAARRPQG